MSKVGFTLVGGSGIIGRRATYLVRSIKSFHSTAPVIVLIPTSEHPPSELVNCDVTIVYEDFPDPDYPISIKIEALKHAEQLLDTEWICLLDTDTILVDRFTAHLGTDAQIRAKPVDMATQYWAQAGIDEWQSLYEQCGISIPDNRVFSTVDKQQIWPYWNSGVVLTRASDLGQRWHDFTIELREEIEAPHHADQVALAVISGDYDVHPLKEKNNYPAHLRAWTRPPKTIIHYHDEEWLLLSSKEYTQLYDQIGISSEFSSKKRDPKTLKMIARSSYRYIKAQLGQHTWDGAW